MFAHPKWWVKTKKIKYLDVSNCVHIMDCIHEELPNDLVILIKQKLRKQSN